MQNKTISDRILNFINGLDLLYVVVLAIGAIGWGLVVVGHRLVASWRAEAWWNFSLMTFITAVFLAGVLWELGRRRPGAFTLVTVIISFVLGASHVLSDSALVASNP